MHWDSSKYKYLPKYQYTNSNQYGARYRKRGSLQLRVLRLTADIGNAENLSRLILFSHSLNVPVHYDFDKQKAWIEVVSTEALNDL